MTATRPSKKARPSIALALCALLAPACTAADRGPADSEGADSLRLARQSEFVGIDEMLDAMRSDILSVPPADRASIRYIALTHLANAGASPAQMAVHRAATNLALNSLSQGLAPMAAVPIDRAETIFRIRLDDYGWDRDTWNRLVASYPYSVRYDEDSELFPIDETTADELRDETETAVPYVHGDWLVVHGMQPPLYYELLGLPETREELESQLGVDTRDDIASGRVDRAGFDDSAVSSAHRIIERFELPDGRALWTTCDLAEGESVFENPIDPDCRGSEIIFSLPNGLNAYFVADSMGRRLDAAPRDLVRDPTRPGGAVVVGLSCGGGCHDATGIIARDDQVRDHVLENGGELDINELLSQYPTASTLRRLYDESQDAFIAARLALAPRTVVAPIQQSALDHERVLDLARAAATLGIPGEELARALDYNVSSIPREVLALRRRNGSIRRATWERVVPGLVCAIGLGERCNPLDAMDCGCR